MINGARLRSTGTEWSYLHVSSVQMKSGVDWWDISKENSICETDEKTEFATNEQLCYGNSGRFIFWQCLYSIP